MSDEAASVRTNGARRVQIRVPEQYRPVSEEVWEDLETYLYQGFLTSFAHVLGKTFVFKTLNHHELRHVQMLRPMRASPPEVQESFRTSFIAHSLFIVDGENVLADRGRRIRRLTQILAKLERGVIGKIVESLSALNGRAVRLHPLTEVYVHENRSRFRWLHVRQAPVHSPVNTGIAGTEELGMNHCQQAWTALNRLLDSKEEMERDWANAKFVGSCFAGKGVRAIDERDRARRERERSELEDLKMKVLHAYLNRAPAGEDAPATVSLPDGRQAAVVGRFQAESVEDLADQLSASLSGEKDYHDVVVDAKIKQLRERASVMEDARRRIYRLPGASADQASGTLASAGARILGGKAEAEALLARRRVTQADQVERFHRQIPGDIQSSDDAVGGRKA